MKTDRAQVLEPTVDSMAQPVTERLPEPPVEVHFGDRDRSGDKDWNGVKL